MERIGEIKYILTRIGGTVYQVDIPMTMGTMDAVKNAQSGREVRLTDQIKPLRVTDTTKLKA